jgi:hypothetical protein
MQISNFQHPIGDCIYCTGVKQENYILGNEGEMGNDVMNTAF